MNKQTTTDAATIPGQATDEPTAAPESRTPEHGARIITELEAVWAAIQKRHPDVPPVVMITGTKRQHGGARWGHYGAKFWAHGQDRLDELFVAGELLAKGGRALLEVLLHEAAHGVASARGIQDTSPPSHRYHNKKFVRIAEELGLTGPSESIPTHGWTDCRITSATAAAYADVIAAVEGAQLPYLGAPVAASEDADESGDQEGDEQGEGEDSGKGKRAGKRFAVECRCEKPRRLQITPAVFEGGDILCGVCGTAFAAVEQDDD